MLVVSDTSPLNYLVLIRCETVLPALFGRVLTTPGVILEMLHAGSPEPVRSWAEAPPKWLEVRAPTAIEPALKLGRGECEAISLARELHADVVLIDERKGSETATKLGLFVTGTLGVLQLADEKQIVPLGQSLTALRQTTFRATDALFESLLEAAAMRHGRAGPQKPG
jgi:predicted nucleic acid-binding protein